MAKYCKKPVVIEAIQWTGEWTKEFDDFVKMRNGRSFRYESGGSLFIDTLEGTMEASKGDYIIRGVNGEYYPCKPDIFEKTYEMVRED